MNYLEAVDEPGRMHSASDTSGADPPLEEALFLERLLFLYEQSLNEIRTFARREGRSYEEVRTKYAW
ncbi:uncharacterized protein PHACADRAFT_252511 [Phanerochaete carnosa HHB-10118-sp]|uniref:Uncharacterized protein n=1 Tax=Phanerochaete carnosa (strain HHB-10118-sp) TaxID=650164 RepID=K5WG91_PHACS|nr:uncharacterized protein PHACADRAFT_252511 [Phanerochaete carnosa HHB-10118-sp]EKM58300.1 hypothetical protein PHACADRAFT_252511 [Phanerochaete carnosa HHB-10118-sp]